MADWKYSSRAENMQNSKGLWSTLGAITALICFCSGIFYGLRQHEPEKSAFPEVGLLLRNASRVHNRTRTIPSAPFIRTSRVYEGNEQVGWYRVITE